MRKVPMANMGQATWRALVAAVSMALVATASLEAQTRRARTGGAAGPPPIDAAALVRHVEVLAADSMEGRRTGTPGNERARRYLDRAFAATGLVPLGTAGADAGSAFRRPFDGGVNLVGAVRGRDTTRVIVITAHYDHLGTRDGRIYNGADDNASGTAALLELARAFARTMPQHTLVFAALDAEESGLRGARAFVADPPVSKGAIAIDINLDMVSRNEKGELWVAGTYHYPFLRPFVERLADNAPVSLRIGHDLPGTGSNDWTSASDHGPFHAEGIPFLYFGVEDHADYHRPTDDTERIDPDFLARAATTVAAVLAALDRDLDSLVPRR